MLKTLSVDISFESSNDSVQDMPMGEVRRILEGILKNLDMQDGMDESIHISEILRDVNGNSIGHKTIHITADDEDF